MKKKSTTYRLNKVDYAIFIIFSIAAAVMLFLFYRDLNSFTIKQSEEPVAKIYFKRNTAQRKFIDNDIWEVLTNSSDIYDGDRIRTSKNSEAYTEFNDSGIQIQLREKSMVQIFKNKKERSVDFIGGEIFVTTTKPDEKIVIHSGKNEISIGQVSEVKIVMPEVSEAVAAGEVEAEESPVVIEVLSGQVEVKEEPAPIKAKTEKTEPEPIVVAAGETVTIEPVVEVPVAAETKSEPVIEKTAIEESVEEGTVTEVTDIEVADEEADIEANIEEALIEETEAEESFVPGASEEELYIATGKLKLEDTFQPAEFRIEKAATKKLALFTRNEWYDFSEKTTKHEYEYMISTSEVTDLFRKIPKGSTMKLEISGVSDKDIYEIVVEVSTGDNDGARAHPWINTIPEYGRGLQQGQRFNFTRYLTLTSDIINTTNSNIRLVYGSNVLDEAMSIADLQIKATVIPEGNYGVTNEINWKFSKTLDYDTLKTIKNQYGKGSGDYNYKVDINADVILGNNVNIPKGKKLKVSISGVSDKTMQNFHLELLDNTEDKWTQIFMFKNDDDWAKLDFSQNSTIKGRKFNYTKTYTVNQALLDSNFSRFSIVIDRTGIKEPPVFTDLHIDMVLE